MWNILVTFDDDETIIDEVEIEVETEVEVEKILLDLI
jgi:hypothetical protein